MRCGVVQCSAVRYTCGVLARTSAHAPAAPRGRPAAACCLPARPPGARPPPWCPPSPPSPPSCPAVPTLADEVAEGGAAVAPGGVEGRLGLPVARVVHRVCRRGRHRAGQRRAGQSTEAGQKVRAGRDLWHMCGRVCARVCTVLGVYGQGPGAPKTSASKIQLCAWRHAPTHMSPSRHVSPSRRAHVTHPMTHMP